jgi:hypothetical protein
MDIVINDNRLIEDVQKEFTEKFSFLKLEFFNQPHKKGEASSKKQLHNNKQTLGESRTIHTNGSITITGRMKVSELEKLFQKMYGLSVQVFRKSGNIWLETTSTDDWTLTKQNVQAKEFKDFKVSMKTK